MYHREALAKEDIFGNYTFIVDPGAIFKPEFVHKI